jgi:hypothetical protein
MAPGRIALPAGSLSTTAHSVCMVKGSVADPAGVLLYARRTALARKVLSPRSHGANDGVTRKTQKEFWATCSAGTGSIWLTRTPGCCQVSVGSGQRRRSALTASFTEPGIIMALLSGRTGGKGSLGRAAALAYPRTGAQTSGLASSCARHALPTACMPRRDCHWRGTNRGIGRGSIDHGVRRRRSSLQTSDSTWGVECRSSSVDASMRSGLGGPQLSRCAS